MFDQQIEGGAMSMDWRENEHIERDMFLKEHMSAEDLARWHAAAWRTQEGTQLDFFKEMLEKEMLLRMPEKKGGPFRDRKSDGLVLWCEMRRAICVLRNIIYVDEDGPIQPRHLQGEEATTLLNELMWLETRLKRISEYMDIKNVG